MIFLWTPPTIMYFVEITIEYKNKKDSPTLCSSLALRRESAHLLQTQSHQLVLVRSGRNLQNLQPTSAGQSTNAAHTIPRTHHRHPKVNLEEHSLQHRTAFIPQQQNPFAVVRALPDTQNVGEQLHQRSFLRSGPGKFQDVLNGTSYDSKLLRIRFRLLLGSLPLALTNSLCRNNLRHPFGFALLGLQRKWLKTHPLGRSFFHISRDILLPLTADKAAAVCSRNIPTGSGSSHRTEPNFWFRFRTLRKHPERTGGCRRWANHGGFDLVTRWPLDEGRCFEDGHGHPAEVVDESRRFWAACYGAASGCWIGRKWDIYTWKINSFVILPFLPIILNLF